LRRILAKNGNADSAQVDDQPARPSALEVDADEQIPNFSGGERRKQFDQVRRDVHRVLPEHRPAARE
jgi:hypothetical protein